MVDPTYELLWKKIGEAYAQVVTNTQRTVEFEHDKYRVQVYHGGPEGELSNVVIVINDDVVPTPPTLIAP